MSQSVALVAKTYTISFCAAVNSTYTNNSNNFTITVDSGTAIFNSSSIITRSSTFWNVYTANFTIATAGTHNIAFNFGCSVGITEVLIY